MEFCSPQSSSLTVYAIVPAKPGVIIRVRDHNPPTHRCSTNPTHWTFSTQYSPRGCY